MRIACIILALASTAFAADWQTGPWSEAENDVRSRILAEKKTYRAGEPILIKLEIENTGKDAKEISVPRCPHFGTLSVTDEKAKDVLYLFGLAQVQQRREKFEAGESKQFEQFDLTEAYYLRKPGRYTVAGIEEPAS